MACNLAATHTIIDLRAYSKMEGRIFGNQNQVHILASLLLDLHVLQNEFYKNINVCNVFQLYLDVTTPSTITYLVHYSQMIV